MTRPSGLPRLETGEVVAGTAMMPLSRVGDRAYPVARDADSRREDEARQKPIEATVVETRPANWFAVRVEIVSGDPSRGAARRPAPVPNESMLYERPRQLPRAVETAIALAPQESAAIMASPPTLPAVVAGRLAAAEVSRAMAAYGAQAQSSENARPARASQRISVRA
jgi:hypothetical protein